MLVTKKEVKQTSKKLLSVLLAIVMLMSTMSVCFGTISFAAGGSATEAQWNTLVNALKNDTVKNAAFSGSANNYTVNDPDGKILEAIEAYYAVFNAMSNKNPTNRTSFGGSSDISKTGESSDTAKRTINQLNTTIKNELNSRMGADYGAYGVANFLTGLLSGANIDGGTSNKNVSGQSISAPSTELSAAPTITLKVKLGNVITSYTLDQLKELTDGVAAEKTFTVTHTNTNYDYSYDYTAATSGCSSSPAKYEHTFYFYYNVNADVVAKDGEKTSVKPITDAAATLEANAAYFSYTLDQFVTAGLNDVSVITNIENTLVAAKNSVVNAFSATVYNHFFSSYNVDAVKATIDKAEEIIAAAHIALDLYGLKEAGYDSIITNKGELESLSQNIKTLADKYDAYASDVKAYVESHEYEGKTFVRSDIADFYNAILKEIELIDLRNLKSDIENEVGTFTGYTEENVADGLVTEIELNYAKGKVQGWINALNTYSDTNVAEVWQGIDIKSLLSTLNTKLGNLLTVNDYRNSFAEKYADYVSAVYSNTNLDADSKELFEAIKGYDNWYTGLKTLVSTIEADLSPELSNRIFKELDEEMKAHLDSKYNALHERVFAQIDLADKLYLDLMSTLGEDETLHASVLNAGTFAEFEKALGHVEVDIYNFLLGSANFDMPQKTIDEFNEIWSLALEDYHNFITSGGFDRYAQTEIPEIIREEKETDNHDAHIGDYNVTDESVEKIINTIDKLLADEDIKAILGNLINKDKQTGEPTGEPFEIADLINGLLEGIYTDDLINTIVQYVYPLVAKEFAKVWAGIDPHVITKADVMANLQANIDTNLNLYDVETAIAGVGIYLAPKTLAAHLESVPEYAGYTDVIATLKKSTTVTKYEFNDKSTDEDDVYTDAWADSNLYVNVLDENNQPVLNDDGSNKTKLNLNWGVTDRASFISAACAALSGLEPLLFALLSNQDFVNPNTSSKPNDVRGCKIGVSGSPSTATIGEGWLSLSLELTLDPITLMFDITGNDGYDNVLAPIFELLGCTNIPHGEELTTTRMILEKGLFGMLDQVIAKISAAPVNYILSVLPNLTYALEVNRIKPLLNNLEISIYYEADAYYAAEIPAGLATIAGILGLSSPITGAMQGAMKAEEDKNGDGVKEPAPVKINIGEMINLDDMGLDLTFSGIWSMVTGALGENVNLPKPDAGYIATLGNLTWKDTNRSTWTYTPVEAGKAAYIEANKADVLIYLVRYLLNALGENPDLLASFNLKLSDDVKAIIADVTADPDLTIATIVELLNQVKYDTLKEYVWYASELTEETVVGLTPAIQQYLAYDNNWTKTTATYLVDNIDTIITAVMAMVGGEDAEPFNLSATLTEVISNLFTNKNITTIAKLLSKIDINALLNKDKTEEEKANALDVNSLVNKFANIDLSSFAAYAELAEDATWGFEDGDKEGFKNALVTLLAPLNGVIDFILAGRNLTLLDNVNLIGYNGYDSAIVPLLEALGAENLAPIGDKSGLEATLDAVLATVDTILADPIDGVLNLIPSLLYFIKSNGLTTAVRNLLHPVYVILETIDPVYALNLNELIGGLTKDLGFTLNLDNLSFEAIFDILGAVVALDLSALEEIIDDVCEVITPAPYKSASTLIGENGKKGAYGQFFDVADLVTVLVSFVLDWAQQGNNANDLIALIAGEDAAKAEEIAKYINGAIVVIGGIDPTYEGIDWAYNFPNGFDESIFESGLTIEPTINTIKYPTNWTEDAAKYIADNLDEIADEIIGLVDENYSSLADFIADKVTIYSADNIDAIVEAVAGLLADIDETLVNTVGAVLGADIAALKAYKADEGIDTGEEFAAALTDILTTIEPVLNWLLFGEDYAFFSKSGTNLVTIKGAEGYAYGLAPILEALGVATPSKDEANITNVIDAIIERVDEILADPVNKVFDVLPNIIYFLNANGISTSVKNLLSGVTALMGALKEQFGIEVDLMTIFNDLINGLLPEDSTVTLDVENLDLESIFNLVQELLGISLAPIADILVDLCVGQIVAYKSASGEYGFKMLYTDDFARYDMITIIVSCLLQVIKLDENEEVLKGMVGEEAYEGILNVISLNINVPVQDFDWALTESADTDEVFSALQASELFGEFQYGPFYTKEMEQYISNNFGQFVDNIIYLLGIEINGTSVETLADLLAGLVGGSVYNSDMIITIRDAIAGLANTLETTLPAGSHILEILNLAEIANLKSVANVEVPEFTDDKSLFIMSLCDVVEPLYPVLSWLLADTDLTFFIDEEENTLVTLPGAEGYAYGLIPVLEAFDCQDIVTPEDYYTAIKNGDNDAIITAIITPILNRVDEILADPATEILSILPNLIYFINSNGVDTVVKNTLNAVYTLLNAIEPIAKVDLYELIGLDLETLTFEKLFDMALEFIGEATGYELTAFNADAIVELTMGKLESYTSVNGKTAYRMIYQEAEAQGEMVTVVLRLAVKFLAHEKNIDAVVGILENTFGMDAEAKDYVKGVLTAIVACIADTQLGMDQALATIYYIFYGVDLGVDETTNGVKDLNAQWLQLLKELGMSDNREEATIGNLIADILDLDIFDDIIDTDEGIAPNGFIAFFKKIIEWFNKLVEWFRTAFNN